MRYLSSSATATVLQYWQRDDYLETGSSVVGWDRVWRVNGNNRAVYLLSCLVQSNRAAIVEAVCQIKVSNYDLSTTTMTQRQFDFIVLGHIHKENMSDYSRTVASSLYLSRFVGYLGTT